ncbi:MAG: DUF1028 domain-containing protein [Melioribacteraceae bacterium]
MKKLIPIILLISSIGIMGQTFYSTPFAHTYSIVARDPVTGDIGAGVQSHWFSVGSSVIWGEAGVGVVATQSFVNVSFGLRALSLLKKGLSPQEVVDELIKSDEGRDFRQLAVLDTKGKSAAYTGAKCIQPAGHITGENFSVQANLMINDKVWGAMEKAFKNSKGQLVDRILEAMDAAQKTGGDIRGTQSASIIVYKGTASDKPWEDKLVDLRVEDSADPISEMKRLVKLHHAYDHMNQGDLYVEKNEMDKAMIEYKTAEAMFPDYEEMKFWHATTLVNANKLEEALPLFKEVFVKNKNYIELVPRLIPSGLLVADKKTLEKILSQAK